VVKPLRHGHPASREAEEAAAEPDAPATRSRARGGGQRNGRRHDRALASSPETARHAREGGCMRPVLAQLAASRRREEVASAVPRTGLPVATCAGCRA
jgi:hypothetical protein